jgi:hypothetical protein
MDYFSISGAWSHGLRFFSDRIGQHALILIGMGLIPAYGAQLLIGGQSSGGPGLERLRIAETGWSAMPPGGAVAILLILLGYVLQTGSYFASWRRGFAGADSLGATIGYGLLAGLTAMGVGVALVAVGAVGAASMGWSGAWLMAVVLLLIPLALACAAFYTLFAALLATAVALALVLAMIVGAITGEVGLAATLTGGSGMITVVLLVMSVVLLWLAARFSCTTSIMAERRSFNPIAAVRLSWQLTLEDQWAIVRYLALIAVVLALVIFGAAALVGVGAAALLEGGAMPAGGEALGIAIGIAIGIPLAFLAVLVPAGIYRELNRASAAAEVFA